MEYIIEKQVSERGGFLGLYDIKVDDEEIGRIEPKYKTLNSNRPYAYAVFCDLENDSISKEYGFHHETHTLDEAKEAVAEFMKKNGIYLVFGADRKLSRAQEKALQWFKAQDDWVHGVPFQRRVVDALVDKGLVATHHVSGLLKSCETEYRIASEI